MYKSLADKISAQMPDLNDKVMRGISTFQMEAAEAEVDKTLRAAAKYFPPGLVYENCIRCTPTEEFNVVTKLRDGKPYFEISRSDFYLVKYIFSYNGTELFPKYLYIPFPEEAGLFHIRGKRFSAHAVLIDPVFSVGMNTVFMQATKARFNFERSIQHYDVNGERETTYVVWSWMHFSAKKRHNRKANTGRLVYSTLGHYMFAQYGFITAMKKYANIDVVVGYDEINKLTYPADKWMVCTTRGIRPRSIHAREDYSPTPLRVAIPIEQYNNQGRCLLAAFYYIADRYPEQLEVEHINDPMTWRAILGDILATPGTGLALMIKEVDEHLQSLDEYLDFMFKDELTKLGIDADSIYDVFMYVLMLLTYKTASDDHSISSMYGKRFATLRYVLYDLTAGINNLMYDLKNTQKKKTLDESTINKIISENIRMAAITGIANPNKHPEIRSVSTSNDNMYFGITSTMVPQDRASGGGKKGKINLDDPVNHLNASTVEVAGYNVIRKSDPSGNDVVNPCVDVSPSGYIIRDPSRVAIMDDLQKRLL